MENEFKPDFENAYNKACEILIQSKTLRTFPFRASKLIEEMSDIEFFGYKESGVPRKIFCSNDAEFMELEGRCIIFYNEEIKDKHRMTFSVLHEFGHYYLQQDLAKLKKARGNKTLHDKLYGKYEVEANFFAAQLLMPNQILRELKRRGVSISQNFLTKTFNVSKQASSMKQDHITRSNYLYRQDNESTLDDCILLKYSDFIDSIAPKKKQFSLENEFEKQKERECWY